MDNANGLADHETYIYIPGLKRIMKKNKQKKLSPGGGQFDYRWKAESPYSWVTLRKKLDRSNNYFSSYRVNKNFFESLTSIFEL